ncbi:hypothetical protein [Chitinophaga sp. S165]|uniref:hypothetical protein n=1 Tax=Chitinophaga sp. S165 TaxID=2135462 RepID=UPI000D7186A0|nr:hypothetical protein [Chitinophaga sp. S165]PWV48343.1 hypothetical protein C7475_107251 [Chitinophaga sp. S165]
MNHYKHNEDLVFTYPEEWTGRYNDGLIEFYNDQDGLGALQFSIFYPPPNEEVDLAAWLEEMLEINAKDYAVLADQRYARFQYDNKNESC